MNALANNRKNTANVGPREEAKIRILNGGHSCAAYLGALAGHRTFDAAMADPVLAEHFRAYEEREVLPALTIPLPFDKAAYLDKIADRFRNANIGDTIERICTDGYAKIPVFIKPTLEDCFKQGITPARGIFSVARWHAFAKRSVLGRVGTQYHEPNMQSLTHLVSTDDLDGSLRRRGNHRRASGAFEARFEFRGIGRGPAGLGRAARRIRFGVHDQG